MARPHGTSRLAAVLAVAIAVAIAVSLAAPAASAGDHQGRHVGAPRSATSISLSASTSVISFGETVELTAQISPAAAGEAVDIVDTHAGTLSSGTTNSSGRYVATIQPAHDLTVRAEDGGVHSANVPIGVRSLVSTGLSEVRLFGQAVVRGKIRPADPGAKVTIALVHGRHTVQTRSVPMKTDGSFATMLHVDQPGTYHARATFDGQDNTKGTGRSHAHRTPLPHLKIGSKGVYVRLLKRRLRALHYYVPGSASRFDARTGDGVMAFTKVQGIHRRSTVDGRIWKQLARTHVPRPVAKGKRHIEIDQSKQVLYVVNRGEVEWILHVSTGKPSTPTPNGKFHVYRKLAGYSPNHLYYPSYFDHLRAIHGWPDVPSYAASHGCTRIPMWAAKWMFSITRIGMRVIVHR
jgi:L,D-transpeptidase catalytic domain